MDMKAHESVASVQSLGHLPRPSSLQKALTGLASTPRTRRGLAFLLESRMQDWLSFSDA